MLADIYITGGNDITQNLLAICKVSANSAEGLRADNILKMLKSLWINLC